MPAADPLPALRDLVNAFGDGVVALEDENADVRRGAVYDHFAGVGGILFAREARHDRDLFRSIYFETADGADLTTLVSERFQIARVLDTYGVGTALLSRRTAAAGAGTIWEGTRILVPSGAGTSAREYAVAADCTVGPVGTTATVDIHATSAGSGVAVHLAGSGIASVNDPLWDPTWTVAAIDCAEGTDFEKASALRARVRATQLAVRTGYAEAISDACVAQGAAHVALFASSYGGDDNDFGINACYVAEAGYTTSTRLLRACTAALEDFRVCGADLALRGMQPGRLTVDADVTLASDPANFNLGALAEAIGASLLSDFDGVAGGYTYSLDAIRGAMVQASDAVQDVALVRPAANGPLLVGTPPNFPAALTRYTLAPQDIVLRFHPSS